MNRSGQRATPDEGHHLPAPAGQLVDDTPADHASHVQSRLVLPPPHPSGAQRRSLPDRIARQVLQLEGAAPRSLIPLRGSLVISAVRCVLAYAVLPLLAPLVGIAGVVGRPISIVLSAAAAILAIVSLRRVWAADWTHRWVYTGFSLLVLTLLTIVIVIDARALIDASG